MKAINMITRLERFAVMAQNRVAELGKGLVRDKVVRNLAQLDQVIAKHKEAAGYLGQDDCVYLNENNN